MGDRRVRYSVRYECSNKNWVVTDGSEGDQVVSTHRLKASAYRQAYAAQERWQRAKPVANYTARIRKVIPQTLVVG